MTEPQKIAKLAEHALGEFPTGIEGALLEHVNELLANPNAKNLADVYWLLEAYKLKYDLIEPIEPRLNELLERKRTTGSLASKK